MQVITWYTSGTINNVKGIVTLFFILLTATLLNGKLQFNITPAGLLRRNRN